MNQIFFLKAKQVYPSPLKDEMNLSLYFVQDFVKKGKLTLYLAGASDYQVFLNGRFLTYGPARAAMHYHRVDVIPLESLQEDNRLAIELSGYNCKSYTRVKEPPFLIAEIRDQENHVIASTGQDFPCYRNTSRLQKVVRFSYQREFAEAYRINEALYLALRTPKAEIALPRLEVSSFSEGSFLPRGVLPYIASKPLSFSLLEGGSFRFDQNLPAVDDRYMHADFLGIFPPSEWEEDSNGYVSRLSYREGSKRSCLLPRRFSTYGFKECRTGFIEIQLTVKTKSKLYLVFDEIDQSKEDEPLIGISFARNTTHNIISYELEPGHYCLNAFEPYTAKYIRVLLVEGLINVTKVSLWPLENPEADNFSFIFEDSRINTILKAGKNTFAQNAVDILMDCPSRERAGWLCDSYFSGRAEQLYTGENLVERNFLENYAHYENQGDQPEKMIPMCYPCDYGDRGYIPNWPMFYVLEIEQFLKRHQDATLLSDAEKQLFDFLSWCERFENADHLLENLEGVVFVEWSPENDLASVSGVNFPTNMLYSEMLRALGEMYGRKDLLARSLLIKEAIRHQGYDGRFFEDNAVRGKDGQLHLSGRHGETTQYYAFHFGIADPQTYPDLYETLLHQLGPKRDSKTVLPEVYPSNMFIGDYLRLLVLLRYGNYQQVADECVDYFYKMAQATGTLWEFDSTYASLTHCFASYIGNILVEIYSGITLVSMKEKKVYRSGFAPILGKDFEFSLPTPDGAILVRSEKRELTLVLPKNWVLA